MTALLTAAMMSVALAFRVFLARERRHQLRVFLSLHGQRGDFYDASWSTPWYGGLAC